MLPFTQMTGGCRAVSNFVGFCGNVRFLKHSLGWQVDW
jgi:hypothetical protein